MSKLYSKLKNLQDEKTRAKEAEAKANSALNSSIGDKKPLDTSKPIHENTRQKPVVAPVVSQVTTPKANDIELPKVEKVIAPKVEPVSEKQAEIKDQPQTISNAPVSNVVLPIKPLGFALLLIITALVVYFLGSISAAMIIVKKNTLANLQMTIEQQQEQINNISKTAEKNNQKNDKKIKDLTNKVDKELTAQMTSLTDSLNNRFSQLDARSAKQLKENNDLIGEMRIKVDGLRLQLDKVQQKVTALNDVISGAEIESKK